MFRAEDKLEDGALQPRGRGIARSWDRTWAAPAVLWSWKFDGTYGTYGTYRSFAEARPVQGRSKAGARPVVDRLCTGLEPALHQGWPAASAKTPVLSKGN